MGKKEIKEVQNTTQVKMRLQSKADGEAFYDYYVQLRESGKVEDTVLATQAKLKKLFVPVLIGCCFADIGLFLPFGYRCTRYVKGLKWLKYCLKKDTRVKNGEELAKKCNVSIIKRIMYQLSGFLYTFCICGLLYFGIKLPSAFAAYLEVPED